MVSTSAHLTRVVVAFDLAREGPYKRFDQGRNDACYLETEALYDLDGNNSVRARSPAFSPSIHPVSSRRDLCSSSFFIDICRGSCTTSSNATNQKGLPALR